MRALGLRLPRAWRRCERKAYNGEVFIPVIVLSYSSHLLLYTRTGFCTALTSHTLVLVLVLTSPLLPRPSAVTRRNGHLSCTARYHTRVRCAGLARGSLGRCRRCSRIFPVALVPPRYPLSVSTDGNSHDSTHELITTIVSLLVHSAGLRHNI